MPGGIRKIRLDSKHLDTLNEKELKNNMLEKERKEKSAREVINLSFDVNRRILSALVCVSYQRAKMKRVHRRSISIGSMATAS